MGSNASSVVPTATTPAPSDKSKECKDGSCSLDKKPVEQADPAKKLKPCCACPETKKARDTCIVERGEENCKELIEAHKECMRKLGFKI